MSVTTARRTTAGATPSRGRSGSPTPRRRLQVVDAAARRRKVLGRRLVAIAAAFLVIGMFAVATAHASLAARQRELDELRSDLSTAEAERDRLERAIVEASSPDAILTRAFELGMVRSVDPVYLGAVEGPDGASE